MHSVTTREYTQEKQWLQRRLLSNPRTSHLDVEQVITVLDAMLDLNRSEVEDMLKQSRMIANCDRMFAAQ